jgi:hypothetical protein
MTLRLSAKWLCIAVSRDGEYRIVRSTGLGQPTERLLGKMPKEEFKPKDGNTFENSDYPDVCPSGGLRLLQPSVAENSQP